MKITRIHRHDDGTSTLIELDTTGEITERTEAQQAHGSWKMIREEAWHVMRYGRETDAGRAYSTLYAAAGKVHEVASLEALAVVTRRERQAAGVRWPEDPRGSA